ncbi:MAG: ABC transporter permease [Phycisphaerales bacterium]|nr:MAG: ABC transporter permease [Phycisphaerales bacterium]
MGTVWQDIRYGLRMLARSPGFTTVTVLTLALGIGASTAMFSVVNTFILDPVPFPGGDRLVEINEMDQTHSTMQRVSPLLYHNVESRSDVFEKTASFAHDIIDVHGDEFAERMLGCRVTPGFFEIFGVRPALGRVLQRGEGGPGNDKAIIISHSMWQRHFGGDAEVIGRKLETSNKAFTVVGVMPRHFQFPLRRTLYWRPFQFTGEQLSDAGGGLLRNWWAIARLKTDVSREEAQLSLDALNQRLAVDFPGKREGQIIRARPLRDFFVDPELQRTLWALLGAIGFVFLIACANLANLQLARTESRLREVSVRMALGAGRQRIVRQLLTENLLLSFLGGLGGILVAAWGIRVSSSLVPSFSPLVQPVGINHAMLLCTFMLSVAAGLACGLFPAWYACRVQVNESLKESGPATSTSLGQRLFRNALVAGEVTLAFVLLVGAGLMIQSVVHMLRVNPGYDPTNLARISLTTRYGWGSSEGLERWRSQFPALADRFAALPGTTAVGLMSSSSEWRYWRAQGKEEPVKLRLARVGVGRSDLFRAIRVPLREGRLFEQGDTAEGQTSVVVNESLARLCWPGASAVDKRIWVGTGADTSVRTIIGVVGDHKE